MKVQALRVEWSALAWMGDQLRPPKYRDKAELSGLDEMNVGIF